MCRGRQIPLCARCLGLLVGPLLSPVFFLIAKPWMAVACISLFLADALTQLIGLRESTNYLRLFTGAVFSASVLFLASRGVALCLQNIKR